jgi:YD repeat-containing protein
MSAYGYNSLGNLAVLTDAGLYTSSVVYDPSGQFVLQALNPLGQATGYAYFGVNGVGLTNTNGVTQPFGALKSTTDANQAVTMYAYDALGRLTVVAEPPNGGGATNLGHWSTHYAYTTAHEAPACRGSRSSRRLRHRPCATYPLQRELLRRAGAGDPDPIAGRDRRPDAGGRNAL